MQFEPKMAFKIKELTAEPGGRVEPTRPGWGFVFGKSPAMLTLESVATEIAPTTIPVLIMGEIGTGKEVFARRVHVLSSHGGSLVKIACASMNAETLSAELGIRGGDGKKKNDSAGTVFFDEISELDTGCQRVLLYALPDGDPKPHPGVLTSRIISATTRNLDDEMKAGRFRSELYYRINGVCLRLPPLRERREDIELLGDFFLTKHAAQLGRPRPSLSERALRVLFDYTWPGNIRELENVVKNIVVLGDEQLAISQLVEAPAASPPVTATSGLPPLSLKVAARAASREAERELILRALARTRWNRKRAAQELQISYKSLLHKLKHIGLPDSAA